MKKALFGLMILSLAGLASSAQAYELNNVITITGASFSGLHLKDKSGGEHSLICIPFGGSLLLNSKTGPVEKIDLDDPKDRSVCYRLQELVSNATKDNPVEFEIVNSNIGRQLSKVRVHE